MARANSHNRHSQNAGREKKLKLANRFMEREGDRKRDLAAIAQKMLKEKLNVETFRDVIIEVRRRRIAQSFVKEIEGKLP